MVSVGKLLGLKRYSIWDYKIVSPISLDDEAVVRVEVTLGDDVKQEKRVYELSLKKKERNWGERR